jgi:hypothetical protein
MNRFTPYVSRPDDHWKNLRDTLTNKTFFLMARHGPCVFMVGDEDGNSYKSVLGNPNTCSCHPGETKMCLHVLFCLFKVLKIRDKHPLLYQTSFTDSELDQILSGSCGEPSNAGTTRVLRPRSLPIDPIEIATESQGFVNRQSIDENGEEYCPICQDSLKPDQQLTWCRKGCGNNIHARCMQTYSQYNISKKNEAQCPLCREPWMIELLKQDCHGMLMKHSCASIYCNSCTFGARGRFYRCIECSQERAYTAQSKETSSTEPVKKRPIDYCQGCYNKLPRSHIQNHHFLTSDATAKTLDDVVWIPTIAPAIKTMDLSSLFNLQDREINANDYDILLPLESSNQPQSGNVNLATHVIQALPTIELDTSVPSQRRKCWCESADSDQLAASSSIATAIHLLPCAHVAHDDCIAQVIAAAGDDLICLEKVVCQHADCSVGIFRGLGRRKKEKKKTMTAREENSDQMKITSSSQRSLPVSKSHLRALGSSMAPMPGTAMMMAISGVNIIQDRSSSSAAAADHRTIGQRSKGNMLIKPRRFVSSRLPLLTMKSSSSTSLAVDSIAIDALSISGRSHQQPSSEASIHAAFNHRQYDEDSIRTTQVQRRGRLLQGKNYASWMRGRTSSPSSSSTGLPELMTMSYKPAV